MGISKYFRIVGLSFFLIAVTSTGFAADGESGKQRIGIIGGGGSGVLSAWMLEDDYDVTLFEKENRLGGHANTIEVKLNGRTYPIDAGFEFFNDKLYPNFMKLLRMLDVPVQKFGLTYSFFRTDEKFKMVLPPIHDGHFKWGTLKTKRLFNLLRLKKILDNGKKIVDEFDTTVSLEQFVNSLEFSKSAEDEFLYPFFAGMWGTTIPDVKKFAAYPILKWMLGNDSLSLKPPKWNEFLGGTEVYIQHLADQLRHTDVRLSTEIESVSFANNKYIVTQKDGSYSFFDHLIIATSAHTASELIKNIPETDEVRQILSKFEYFHTVIAVHGDRSYMPVKEDDWSTFNIRSNGQYSQATVHKPWKSPGLEIFRSWITHDVAKGRNTPGALPKKLYSIAEYDHPKQTVKYYRAQRELLPYLGRNNLWLAGVYTHDSVSHESVVQAVSKLVNKLDPHSPRLQRLLSQ